MDIYQPRIIPPRMTKTMYGCHFCNKTSVRQAVMIRHLRICYKNPDRDCDTCDNEGVEFIHSIGPNLGVIFDADSKDCSSCLIAQERGGKSYIKPAGEGA